MNVEEFWNLAFIAAMHRLSPAEAEIEANKALDIVIKHWQSTHGDLKPVWTPFAQQRLSEIYRQSRSSDQGAGEAADKS
ncbi:MAG: hypothetical protein HHJ17_15580 [Rhodoferax sp.]|uniref:hypothetical protein n=1 Tax=Rhodoferax sp. TaxID=50421 RepID=UPI001792A5EE|nr:hypothetical protein [Rhodoferax sp.]NMM14941.1 hypothetical protein [Rhodoferax sp.]